jgi:hypothetical protein
VELEIRIPLRNDHEYHLERLTPGRREWIDVEVSVSNGCLVARSGDLIDPGPGYHQRTIYLEEGKPTPRRLRRYLEARLAEGYRLRPTPGLDAWREALEQPRTQASLDLGLQRSADDSVPDEARTDWERIKATLHSDSGGRLVRGVLTRELLRGYMYADAAKHGRGRVAPVEVDPAEEPGYAWENCHALASAKPNRVVVTGWALAEGWWHPHAWCWDGVDLRILETIAEHELYWGHPLSLEDAGWYARSFS